MTVTNETSSIQYLGTGTQKIFPYTFLISSLPDLRVYVNNIQQFTGFTVSGIGNPSGGNVTFTVAPANGLVVALVRFLPLTQIMDYTAYDAFPAESHESALDKLTMIAQQLQSQTLIPLPPTIDASAIPYLAGGTGAVTRSVEAKLRDGVSVTDFGADPLGNTDSTAAIQAALNYVHAGGLGELYAPAGTYLTGEIAWPGNNITLRGAGSAYSYDSSSTPRTIFKAKAGTTTVFNLVQTGAAQDRSGNHLVDFSVDGNAIAADGIRTSSWNLIERVRVKGCTAAGLRMMNLTNSSHVLNCTFYLNSGWGLVVEGVSTTTFSVTGTNTQQNTLGGILLEGGNNARFANCVSESNAGPGLRIYRPNTHTNIFVDIQFDNCWFEANASASPYFTLEMDSYNDTALRNIFNVHFRYCRISASAVTRKYMNLSDVNGVTFDRCSIAGSTAADAITLDAFCTDVGFIESASSFSGGATDSLTAAQIDAAIAQGTRCYSSDRDTKRDVATGIGFANSWVNYGAPFSTAKYWFDREGNVHLEGGIKSGTLAAVAFTLPVGYRPAASQVFAVSANNAIGIITIAANGTVAMTTASATYTSLDGIVFQTG